MPGQPDFDATNGDEGVVMDEAASEVSEPTDEDVKTVNNERARRASIAARDHRGPSALWDDDQEWILIFDRLLNEPSSRGRQPGPPPSARSTRMEPDRAELDRTSTRTASVACPSGTSAARRPPPRKASDGGDSSGGAGAIDEATFIASFERVPRLQVFSPKDLEVIMSDLRETLDKQSNDWSVRIEALKKLRGVLLAGGADFDDLYRHLRLMEPALQLTVQDLRSQVVREGCITIAYLSQQLGRRVDHVCYSLLPYLIELIPNSAKVWTLHRTDASVLFCQPSRM